MESRWDSRDTIVVENFVVLHPDESDAANSANAIFPTVSVRGGANPEGIESFSPALAMQSPTLGDGAMNSSTLKGLNGVATAAGAGDATPLGWELFWGTITQGRCYAPTLG